MSKKVLTSQQIEQHNEIILNDNMLFDLSVVPQMIVNQDRVIIRVNKKFKELFGYENDDILGKRTLVLTPSEERFDEYRQYFTQTKEGIFKSEELEYKKSDNSLFWTKLEGIQIHERDDDILILWSFIDIDKEVKYREKLKELASVDPMTGLYNRRFFMTSSSNILELAHRDMSDTSVIMLDIDKFKNINDTYGHQVGDEVIIALSDILKKYTRQSDIICRFGGEEFLILLPKTKIEGAVIIAEKLRSCLEKNEIKLSNNETLQFTTSFGVSQVDIKNDKNIESTIKRADAALYEAKNGGRNRVCS